MIKLPPLFSNIAIVEENIEENLFTKFSDSMAKWKTFWMGRKETFVFSDLSLEL